MNSMVLGLLLAAILVVLAIFVPGLATVSGFLERIGCLTIFFWALVELVRGARR